MNFLNMNFTFHEFAVNMNNNFIKRLWIWIWKLWKCHEYEFKTHEWVHIWTKIAWIWIWILMPIYGTDMTNIITLTIHEPHGLYEPKQYFFSRKIELQPVKEIKKLWFSLQFWFSVVVNSSNLFFWDNTGFFLWSSYTAG